MLAFDDALEQQARRLTPTALQLARIDSGIRDVLGWLQNSNAEFGPVAPVAFTQGSVRLRTSITPRRDCGFDADVVCLLPENPAWNRDSREPFDVVGRAMSNLHRCTIEQKKRCWAVHYDAEFHVDVIPAVTQLPRPGSLNRPAGLAVFDNELNRWKSSDPIGFSDWFYRRAHLAPNGRRIAPIDPVADADWRLLFASSLPLCRAVQLLKRARDVWFGVSELAPKSILLTTLAARHYSGQATLHEALLGIADGVVHDLHQAGVKVVNPVDATEELSENWRTDPAALHCFRDFARALRDKLAGAAASWSGGEASFLDAIFGHDGCVLNAGGTP